MGPADFIYSNGPVDDVDIRVLQIRGEWNAPKSWLLIVLPSNRQRLWSVRFYLQFKISMLHELVMICADELPWASWYFDRCLEFPCKSIHLEIRIKTRRFGGSSILMR